jgi:hypothetical protein
MDFLFLILTTPGTGLQCTVECMPLASGHLEGEMTTRTFQCLWGPGIDSEE